MIRFLILEPGEPVLVDSGRFAALVSVPLTATFVYLLAVFSFGFTGDLAARHSMYPARMFTLPVTNAALVGWPMLYGTAAMAILWLAALDTVVLLAIHFKAGEARMVAILAPQVPLAYLVARFAVARARRGDVPDWRGVFAWLGRIADVLPSRRDHFSSPARAQTWFEWRQHGRSLPAWVGILLPFELALLFVTGDTPALVTRIALVVLLTPLFMAAFTAATVRRSPTPFIATRPLSSAALIAATLQATIRSAAVAWVLVLGAIPVALRWSGTWSVVVGQLRQ